MLCPDTPPADDRDCQFLTCHADLDNRRLPRHKRFFSVQSGFFRWKPIFLGLFERNLERAGIWREVERWMGQLSTQDCDNPQRLLIIRDGGLIGTPDAIATIRTQSRRSLSRSTAEQEQVCLQAFRLFDSTHNFSRKSRNRSPFSDPSRVRFIALTVSSSVFFLPRLKPQSQHQVRRAA